MVLWMSVTRDKYEHPVHIADSIEELAEKCGVTVSTIKSTISRNRNHGTPSRYYMIEVEDECQN